MLVENDTAFSKKKPTKSKEQYKQNKVLKSFKTN